MKATLTAVTAPLRGSRRRVLEVDGEAWRTTSRAVVERLGLEAGLEVDLGSLRSALDEAEAPEARRRALAALGRRDLSAAELIARLADDGYPADLCARIAEAMRSDGYIDDVRYATASARTLLEVRGYGRTRALRTLTARGIEPETALAALDAVSPRADEPDRALCAAQRLAPAARGSVERLARRLVTRGFDPSTAFAAARRALPAEDPGRLDG